MERIAVSVIIPVYNSEKYLNECLKSVETQSLREIEIICVDNASTDASASIIKDYCSRDKRFAYIRNERNRGQAYSRNVGLDRARGKYIYFVDSDDMLCEGALFNLCKYMEQDELDGILFDALIVDGEGRVTDDRSARRTHVYPAVTDGEKMFSMLVGNGEHTAGVWRQVWKREFLLFHHIYFFEMGVPHEDTLFSVETLMIADRVKCVQDICYFYRRHSNSITALATPERISGVFTCFVEIMMRSKIWLKNKDKTISDSMFLCLSFYRRYINRMINALLQRGISLSKVNFRTEFYTVLFHLFVKQKDEIIDHYILHELMEGLSRQKKLIIYGCGTYGKKIMKDLDKLNITNYFVAVTNKFSVKFDRHVYQIDELQEYREEALVLIAVSEIYQAEIVENLKRMGFRNYLCVV